MRCLALAARFSAKGHSVGFFCRDLAGAPFELIEKAGFRLQRLPLSGDWEHDANDCVALLQDAPADILVMDSYVLDARWERPIHSQVTCLAVIDDLANREHDCDVLIDQNLYVNPTKRYADLVPDDATLLLGPRFALLRQEFVAARAEVTPRRGLVQKVVVFYTGGDDQGETLKALQALAAWRNDLEVDVVIGAAHPDPQNISAFCRRRGWHFHCQIDYMASLLAKADLALGAGGSSSWERCALGVPALVCVLADNQAELTEVLAAHGAVRSLGWAHQLTSEDYRVALDALDTQALATMSRQAWELVDGLGAERVCDVLFEQAQKQV